MPVPGGNTGQTIGQVRGRTEAVQQGVKAQGVCSRTVRDSRYTTYLTRVASSLGRCQLPAADTLWCGHRESRSRLP